MLNCLYAFDPVMSSVVFNVELYNDGAHTAGSCPGSPFC